MCNGYCFTHNHRVFALIYEMLPCSQWMIIIIIINNFLPYLDADETTPADGTTDLTDTTSDNTDTEPNKDEAGTQAPVGRGGSDTPDNTTSTDRCCPDVDVLPNGMFKELEDRVQKIAKKRISKSPKAKIERILSKIKKDIVKNLKNPSKKVSNFIDRVTYEVLKNMWKIQGRSNVDIKDAERSMKVYKANISDVDLDDFPDHMLIEASEVINTKNSTANLRSDLKTSAHVNKNKNLLKNNHNVGGIQLIYDIFGEDSACDCNCKWKKACDGIRKVKEFTCPVSEKIVPIYKVCDGIVDCEDESDEYKCFVTALDAVHNARRLLNGLRHTSFTKCLSEMDFPFDDIQDNILNQQYFLSNYESNPRVKSIEEGNIKNKQSRDVVAVEGFVIVSSVSVALDTLICESSDTDIMKNSINIVEGGNHYKYKIIYPAEEVDSSEILVDFSRPWSSKPATGVPCSCEDEECIDAQCTPECERICKQRFLIGRWVCNTENNEKSISLNDLCDGKFDCIDKSDESDCNNGNHYGRFIANGKFNSIVKLLTNKLASDDFRMAATRLQKILDAVRELQKQNSNTAHVKLEEVRFKRDEAFRMLKLLFDDVTPYVSDTKVSDVFEFIMNICKDLASALKQTNVGNVRVITSEECECKDTKCDMLLCTQQCIRYCNVRSHFASIICSDSYKTVDFMKICNKKTDCANGDDEKDCRKDMCLKRHLKQLEVDLKLPWIEDSSLGDILGAWRRSVMGDIKKAHAISTRLTISDFRTVVYGAITKLLMLFASIEDVKKSNSPLAWNSFLDICQLLIKALKYCGK